MINPIYAHYIYATTHVLITVWFSYKSKVIQDNYEWLEVSEKKSMIPADVSKASTNLPSNAWVKGAFHTQSQ